MVKHQEHIHMLKELISALGLHLCSLMSCESRRMDVAWLVAAAAANIRPEERQGDQCMWLWDPVTETAYREVAQKSKRDAANHVGN